MDFDINWWWIDGNNHRTISLGSIEDINPIILSGIKVGIALVLIFVWVFTLTKVKNWIFKTDVKP